MLASVKIREAVPSDLEALLPLVQGYRVFYKQQRDAAAERELIAGHLRDGTSTILIAHDGADAVGFVQIFAYRGAVSIGATVILEDLYVDPKARGLGVADALLLQTLEFARSIGALSLLLETAVDNHVAQRVYERCGWVREGRFVKYNAPLR